MQKTELQSMFTYIFNKKFSIYDHFSEMVKLKVLWRKQKK